MPTPLTSMLAYIRRHELLLPGDRVGVAVSGGADSVALLRLLLEARVELGIVLAVVHFNHKIREAADADEAFVAELARQHELAFHSSSGETVAHARKSRQSLEAAARQLRYRFFRNLLTSGTVNRIATAHTLDDQAETVLLRFLRGAGTRGLAGIYPRISIQSPPAGPGAADQVSGAQAEATIVRPLLATRRKQLRDYLGAIGQSWREDATNLDLKYSRNRVRQELIPLLEREYNPALQQVLAETAEVAREEEVFWVGQVSRILSQVVCDADAAAGLTFSSPLLQQQPVAMQRRLIRTAAQRLGAQLEFHHVEQVLQLLGFPGGETRHAELPGGLVATSSGGRLRLELGRDTAVPAPYEYELAVPGEVRIPQAGLAIRALLVDSREYNRDHLLDPGLLGSGLRVRNWRPGDRYRPTHTKSPRKLKQLLQERHISHPLRAFWPVVVSRERIVWVPGWDVPYELQPRGSGLSVLLQQEPLAPGKCP